MLLKDNIPVSYVLGKIKMEMLVVSAYAVLVAVAYQNFHFTRISIPIAVLSIVGTVLSLLLDKVPYGFIVQNGAKIKIAP